MTYRIEWSRVTNSSGVPLLPSKISAKQLWMSGGRLSSNPRPNLLKEEEPCSFVYLDKFHVDTEFCFGKKGPKHLRWDNGSYGELIWVFPHIPIPRYHPPKIYLSMSHLLLVFYFFWSHRTVREDGLLCVKLSPSDRGRLIRFSSVSLGSSAATYKWKAGRWSGANCSRLKTDGIIF